MNKTASNNISTAATHSPLQNAIEKSWSKIAPFWPLKNLIAVNPLAGFETLPFEEGLKQGQTFFQQSDLPKAMAKVNRESIKWLQAFYDQGQATIPMPNRHLGLLHSTLTLIQFDSRIHQNDAGKKQWLCDLIKKSPESETIILNILELIGIKEHEHEAFLTLMLATLPGWAAYTQYQTQWLHKESAQKDSPVSQTEYLAFRLILTYSLWQNPRELLSWHHKAIRHADTTVVYDKIVGAEKLYQTKLLKKLNLIPPQCEETSPQAQFVFCIDVRSEPFRHTLESIGDYETYGFAGFFGLPISIKNMVTGKSHTSCPALLKPEHCVEEHPHSHGKSVKSRYSSLLDLKKLYQSLKYTFATPFSLVETVGLPAGVWMGLKSLFPKTARNIKATLKKSIVSDYSLHPDISVIPFADQVRFAENALRMMGLTKTFSPLVVFCGHGSTTQNNAYGSMLDCGACGGHQGASNARILAAILNTKEVRQALLENNLKIPEETIFIGAHHNTTTDDVTLFSPSDGHSQKDEIQILKQDLIQARNKNSAFRIQKMGLSLTPEQAHKAAERNSKDWAQVQPEWGLARNASFIIGPRWLTEKGSLDGRSFLHSYEWEQDQNANSLTTILTAPMIVTQWINGQYLFSTLDNTAFGGGNKVTKNITGKIGVTQGNASDLMHGLPYQSVYASDGKPYHEPMRLTVVVYAPNERITSIIHQHEILQKLFENGWIHLICCDPILNETLSLQRDLSWIKGL